MLATLYVVVGSFVLVAMAAPVQAQRERERDDRARDREVRVLERARVERAASDDQRAMLGINTSSGGHRDTLGLLITGVVAGGPAERAGLEEGQRIAEINGVSLQLAPEDVEQSDMQGLTSRRLTRAMQSVRPGEEVALRVWADGRYRTVRVRTVSAADLPGTIVSARREDVEERAVLGLSLNASGGRRDTLGILIVRVYENGPAERAGLVEGDRIQAINGVDLRVSPEDAGDSHVSQARHSRFTREMRTVRPGDQVELRVYSEGDLRRVRLRAAMAKDVYAQESGGLFFRDGGAATPAPRAPRAMPPMPPVPPMPALPAPSVRLTPRVSPRAAPRVTIESFPRSQRRHDDVDARHRDHDLDHDEDGDRHVDREDDARTKREIERHMQQMRRELGRARQEMERAQAEMQRNAREQERARAAAERAMAAPRTANIVGEWGGSGTRSRAPRAQGSASGRGQGTGRGGGVASASGYGENYVLGVAGLRVTGVGDDLASYFGRESRQGLLVLETGEWRGLRVGDVILRVNGRPVFDGERARITLSTEDENEVEILRRGDRRRVTVSR